MDSGKMSDRPTQRTSTKRKQRRFRAILVKALRRAAGGGAVGGLVMVLQILTLMWLRTIVSIQYSTGDTFLRVARRLYAEGGIRRFYAGFWAAMLVGPLCRFGDTAANSGILVLCDGVFGTAVSTMFASLGAALWRIVVQPVQNVKTLMQVEGGAVGLRIMNARVKEEGLSVLWNGAFGTVGATWLGHFPWFATFNFLNEHVPTEGLTGLALLMRNASIGFCASLTSDCVSNAVRVVSTTRATKGGDYADIARGIVAREGLWGFTRGLGTKLVSNGLSAMLFSVLFRHFSSLLTDTDDTDTATIRSTRRRRQVVAASDAEKISNNKG